MQEMQHCKCRNPFSIKESKKVIIRGGSKQVFFSFKCKKDSLSYMTMEHNAQSSLSIFAQKYLRKCKDTYFILQNKYYIRIYEDSFGGFGAKILRDICPPNPHHLTWSILTSLLFDNPNSRRALKAFRMILLAGLFFLVSIQILSVDEKKNKLKLLSSGFHDDFN